MSQGTSTDSRNDKHNTNQAGSTSTLPVIQNIKCIQGNKTKLQMGPTQIHDPVLVVATCVIQKNTIDVTFSNT